MRSYAALLLAGLAGFVLALPAVSAPSASSTEPPAFVLVGPPLLTLNGCRSDLEWTKEHVSKATGFSVEDMELGIQWRALNLDDFCILPKNRLTRAISRVNKPKPDSPGDWAKSRALDFAEEDGQIKPDGLMTAVAQREAMLATSSNQSLAVAGIRSDGWTNLGPGNIGGRIRAISINPTNTNDILIGSVSGGFFRSSNGGTSFTSVNDFLVNLAVSTIARDPNTPTRVYAGTGEGFFNSDAVRGYGVFVSNDGGSTWSQLGGTAPDTAQPPSSRTADFAYVNRVAVHPTNSNIVLVATSGYYSNWGGVYMTSNALAPTPTWTLIYGRRALDVKFDPNNPNRVVVGEGSHSDPTGGTDGGGGVGFINDITTAVAANSGNAYIGSFTRTKLTASQTGRVELGYAKATNGLVVALQELGGGTFYVSTDSGQTWAQNSVNSNLLSTQGWYDNVIWVDPTDSTRIIVGGVDLWKSSATASWWTTNTALTWSRVSQWQFGGSYGPSAHADHHAIVADPGYNGTTNRRVYFGNDGGLYKADDVTLINGNSSGTGWTKLNNGLEVTQFYSGAGTIVGGVTRIQGGTQDNGQLLAPASGTNWTTWQGGDGGYAAVDPADTNVFYGAYVRAAISRTKNGGASMSYICKGTADNVNNITEGLSGASYCGTAATNETNFITPFVLDPNNSNRMLVGAKSLWISTDVKTATSPSWAIRKAAIGSGSTFYINAVAVAPGNPDIIWVGHNNGAVYCTTNGTSASPTWTQTASSPARRVLRIMIDQSNNNRVFVAYGGFQNSNLQETTAGCVASPTWTNRHNNLPSAPVRSIVRHPGNASWLYASTEVGVFASIDGGVTWSASTEGPGSVSTDEIFWLDAGTMIAATHGRGMFKTTISSGALQFTSGTATVAEGAGTVTLTVSRVGGAAGPVSVSYNTIAEVGAGKATAGSDYTVASGTLTWNDGELGNKTINVGITNDASVEGPETFRVDLSAPAGGAVLGGTTSVTVTITDDDVAVAKRFDLNGDGRSDVIWYHTGVFGLIGMEANGLALLPLYGIDVRADANWQIAGIGDLNGDGRADVIWHNGATGAVYGLLMNGSTILSQGAIYLEPNTQWKIEQVADTDGDGKADLVWKNQSTGEVYIMRMNGLAITSGQVVYAEPNLNWKIVASGDMNGDGKADLLWRNQATGDVFAMIMNGYTVVTGGVIYSEPNTNWKIIGLADFNGDGKADVLWQNTATGDVFEMQMNGTVVSGGQVFYNEPNTQWKIVALGDYNGDGKADVLWQNGTTGQVYMMLMNGFTVSSAAFVYTEPDTQWKIVGP